MIPRPQKSADENSEPSKEVQTKIPSLSKERPPMTFPEPARTGRRDRHDSGSDAPVEPDADILFPSPER